MPSKQLFDIEAADREGLSAIAASPHGERLLRALCGVGPRPAGSEGMRRAAGTLAEEWRALGANDVHTEAVSALAWEPEESTVELLAPTPRSFASLHAVNSAATVAEGRLVAAVDVSAEGLRSHAEAMRGALVLLGGHRVSAGKYEPLQQRISIVEDAGAAGILLAGSHPKLPAVHFMYRPVSIPVVSLSGEDAAALAALADSDSARARVATSGRSREATCVNLIGELGPDDAEETIIVSAHLDSHYISPGAFDNLSGVVTLTETARALAPYPDRFIRRLRLIAYTAEEYGFAGSRQYAAGHADELDRIRFVLNLDAVFDDTARGLAVIWAPEMREYLDDSLRRLRAEVDVRNLFCMSSDYLPFILEGIPAARPATWGASYPPWSHTREDTEDRLQPEWISANAVLCFRVLLRMLTDPAPLPSRRRTADEVRELVHQEDAQDALRWIGMLP